MISLITGRQPPHMRPARHARATWRTLRAPSRTAFRTWRSLTPWQWQTITRASRGPAARTRWIIVEMKMDFNIDVRGELVARRDPRGETDRVGGLQGE